MSNNSCDLLDICKAINNHLNTEHFHQSLPSFQYNKELKMFHRGMSCKA